MELGPKNEEVNMMVQITLTPQQVKALVKTGENAAPKLGGVATWLLSDLAKGGVMLEPDVVKAISKHLKNQNWSGGDLLPLVERGVGMQGDNFIATWKIDPTYEPMLRELAENQGRTVNELVQELMDWAAGQGWFYQWEPEPKALRFTPEDYQMLAEATGKQDPNGTDIANFVKEMSESPVAAR